MKKENSGFTLIELIVVIAIMAIFTGMLGLSVSMIMRQRVSTSATSLKETMVLARNYTKSKGNCKVTIQGTSNDGCKIFIYTGGTSVDLNSLFSDSNMKSGSRLGNGPTYVNKKIKTKVKIGSDYYEVDAGKIVDIVFDRRTGGFKCAYFGSSGDLYSSPGITKGVPTEIVLDNGSRKAVLNLATYTGTVTIDYTDSTS